MLNEKYIVEVSKDKYMKDFFTLTLHKSDEGVGLTKIKELKAGYDFYGYYQDGYAYIRGFKKHLELSGIVATFGFVGSEELSKEDMNFILEKCKN